MNKRAKGRKFEKQEEKAWTAMGWETELVRPEARFIGPNRFVTGYRDFFGGRYDLIVASPKVGIVCLIQVSTGPPSSHSDPGPMGFLKPAWGKDGLDDMPLDVMLRMPNESHGDFSGVYEIFAQYKREGRSPYTAHRTWWTRKPSTKL